MGVKERLEDIYFSLESKYYSFIDRLVEKGMPADRIVTAIEGKGIPSFPIFALVTILLISGMGYGVYSVFGPKTYTITIYDASGNPLANTSVYIDGKMYVTDEYGQVELKGIEGPVTVVVDGYKESSVDPEVSEYVYLAPIKKKVIITALERGSAKKLAGIRVKVYGRNTKEISGNPAIFYISEVPAEDAVQVKDGKVIVEILSTTHRKEKAEIEWSDEETIEKTVYLTPIAEIVKRGTIVVYVKPDNVGGTAKLYSGSTLVKETPFEDGIARFYSIPYGKYTVKFEVRIGGKTITDPKNSVDVDHKSSKTEAEITLTLPEYTGGDEYDAPENLEEYVARIRVMDENTGEPIKGAKLWDAETETRIGPKSNSKGIIEVTFTDSDGEMNVYVTKSKYYNSKYFVIRPGQEVNVYLVRMPATGTVNLCVITPTGDGGYIPVPKAYFKLWKDDWEVTGNAGADGCAEIEDVPVGDVNIYVTDPYGEYPTYDVVEVKEDESTDERVVLTMKVNVTVNVYSLENRDKRIAAVVEAYSGSGKKIGEEPTGISVGASFELPAKEYIYFKITYGKGKVYQTEMKIFYSDETVNIYVPEKETKSAEFVAIKNENDDRVFMLKPGKEYDLVLRVVCKGSCSFPLSGKDISVPEEVNVSCTNICSKEVTVPISAEAQGEGVGSITVDGKEIEIPYGYELSEADARGSAYARILAFLDGEEADPDALSTLKEYNIVIPFAAKTAVDDPYIDVSSDLDLKDTETEVLGRMGDYVIGIVTFKVFAEERDRYEIVIDVEGGPEIDLRLRFTKEGERKKMNLDVGSVALKNCERVAIPYHLTDANTGEDLNGPISVDIYGDDWLYDTLTLDEAKGFLEIPTGADEVLLVFRALGYYDANAMIELEEVKITPSKVTVTVAPDQKKASANIEYNVNPDWLDLNISDAEEEDFFGYDVSIKMGDKLRGTVTVVKKGDTFSGGSMIVTVEQEATAETDQYSCTFQIHPEINVVESKTPVECQNYGCNEYLDSVTAVWETGETARFTSDKKEINVVTLWTKNKCMKYSGDAENVGGEIEIQIKPEDGENPNTCYYGISNYMPLYYDEDSEVVAFKNGRLKLGEAYSQTVEGTDECPPIEIIETNKQDMRQFMSDHDTFAATIIALPKEWWNLACKENVEITLTPKIWCGAQSNGMLFRTMKINFDCGKTYPYYDISGVRLPCAGYGSNNTCDEKAYDTSTGTDNKLRVNVVKSTDNVETDVWLGPYAALLLLHNNGSSISELNVIFGKVENTDINIGGEKLDGLSVFYWDDEAGEWNAATDCIGKDTNYLISLKAGEFEYNVCTDSPELAYYYLEQSNNWGNDVNILPATISEIDVKELDNLPKECEGKLISASVVPASLWFEMKIEDKEENVTVFGKSLDDYYRLVAATAGYNATDEPDGEITKDVPVSIILDPEKSTVIATNPQTGDGGIKYADPKTSKLPGNHFDKLVVSDGKLYYVKEEMSLANGARWAEEPEQLTSKEVGVEYCGEEGKQEESFTITAKMKITLDSCNGEYIATCKYNCTLNRGKVKCSIAKKDGSRVDCNVIGSSTLYYTTDTDKITVYLSYDSSDSIPSEIKINGSATLCNTPLGNRELQTNWTEIGSVKVKNCQDPQDGQITVNGNITVGEGSDQHDTIYPTNIYGNAYITLSKANTCPQ